MKDERHLTIEPCECGKPIKVIRRGSPANEGTIRIVPAPTSGEVGEILTGERRLDALRLLQEQAQALSLGYDACMKPILNPIRYNPPQDWHANSEGRTVRWPKELWDAWDKYAAQSPGLDPDAELGKLAREFLEKKRLLTP